MAAALRRGPARPGSESAVVPRLPSPARAPPSTCRAECDPSPPAALSLRAAELPASAGPSRARSWPGRPRAPPGAGCSGPQCRRTRRDCRRDDGRGTSGRAAASGRVRPRVRRRRPGLGILPRTEAQDGGCFGGAERVLLALWTFPILARLAPLARTLLFARSRFGC